MSSFNSYEHVFKPLKAGRNTLKNRIIFSPMVSDFTDGNGGPLQGYIDFVEQQAMSGAAVVTLGATPINWENAADYPAELDVTDDHKINQLALLAEAAHRHGAKLSVELLHAGRAVHPDLIPEGEWGIAPSNMPIPGQYQYIREMNRRDMDHIIDCYVDCALRVQRAQFDGVLMHSAHGNMIAQWLSPLTNHRTDFYGGPLENRMRFPLEILAAVREATGPDFLIDMRISGSERVPGGMEVDEVIEYLKQAQQYVDMCNISGGLIVDWKAQYYTMPPYYQPHLLNLDLARKVKACPDIEIPITAVGRITTIDEAEQIIASGAADGVYMARALLADTQRIPKAWRGESDKARPCLGCFCCAEGGGHHIACAINPQLGFGQRFWEVPLARTKKKVVVVGGGPAGMQAAQTLIERGHEVVLFEKQQQLGGKLNDINKLPFKDDLLKYTQWDAQTTLECGADVRLGVEATPELVMAQHPDAIVVATGGEVLHLPLPGFDSSKVVKVTDVDSGRVKVSGKIVVCGAGASGCESALALAMDGNDVTLVDQLPVDQFAKDVTHITRGMLINLLAEYGVTCIGDSLVRGFVDGGVKIEDHDWHETILEADYVVEAFGVKPLPTHEWFELIPEVVAVGDADGTGNIMKANRTAFDRAWFI